MRLRSPILPALILILTTLSAARGAENTDAAYIEYKFMAPSKDTLKTGSEPDREIKTTHHSVSVKVNLSL